MALKATIVALALSSVDGFAPSATGASRRPAFCNNPSTEAEGKKGLDAFPGTNLEALLKENNIETLALCGFLTNCCVESSMRTAYEKGFNTVTLTDCCATTSAEGQAGATGGTFGMFSDPMTADDFVAKL